MQTTTPRGGRRNLSWLAAGAAVTALAVASGSGAYAAGGGTAKGGGTAANPPQVVIKAPPPINWSGPTTNAINIHSFDVTGFIEDATVSNAACPGATDPHLYGGTALVNGLSITIPCNLVMQMPASAWTWADLFDPVTNPEPLTLDSTAPRTFRYPSTEISITGNIVNGRHVAGLILMSQQSTSQNTGTITGIDYGTGIIKVATGPAGSAATALLQINDPNGRFGLPHSPDRRFQVDDENPTIHAATGYPMCVPRTDPATADDPLCPQRNRPKVNQGAAFFGCRSFASPGVNVTLPGGQTFAAPVPGQVYCSAFVMKDPKDPTLLPSEPDAMRQAPFEIGDFITWQGTLLQDGSGIFSVHTIEANVGIFTQPGTLPAYVAIGEFSMSSDTAAAGSSIAGTEQEAQNRFVLEAMTTDVTSVADVYLVDKDPVTGQEYNRWITPESMTGGVVPGTPLPILVNGQPSTVNAGGITTQFTGPLPGRIRIRANKATPGILVSPTRNVRVALRSLCTPDAFDLDPATGLPDPTKPSINYKKVVVNGVTTIVQTPNINVNFAVHGTGRPGDGATCLQSFPAANGLFAGQYLAPEFTYIFPENVVPGDPIVPYDLWSMGFLVNGEGPGTGRLLPPPW
jgi:hypothetical protein